MLRIAIDVMSGDLGLRSSLPAAAAALAENPQLQLFLVGRAAEIRAELARLRLSVDAFTVIDAADVVTMAEKPSAALRHKRESSMWKSVELLRDGNVDGVVSAGNTGALMAMGRFLLQTLPGIDRPAICAPIPGRDVHTYLLDLGANVDCSPLELHQFAAMGAALVKALDGIAHPRVALLNIGEELIKGNDQVKAAAALIAADASINYVGFVEGDDIFHNRADVVVCDGFVGNVALKVCEGTASLIAEQLKGRFTRNLYGWISGFFVQPLLQGFHKKIDPERYNGAALLGLKGVVVKSHGGSTERSFQCAIRHATQAVQHRLPAMIEQQLAQAATG